ncbi:MAG: polysulfide reductase NrfD [Nitrospirae bacterium]|nr:polysulfide reductase NrfD [Nitrospirota bacterium]
MIRTIREDLIFQKDWAGRGERGLRDQMLMPAIFFGAISPGLYLSSLFTDFTAGLWVSVFMNILGYGVTHLLYLGKMERFWRGLLNIRQSWISRGLLFNILFTITSVLYLVVTGFTTVSDTSAFVQNLKWASVLCGILFLAYPGFMLSFVKAIPFWHSAVEPALFFLQGLLGGTAAELLLGALYGMDATTENALIKINYILLMAVLLITLSALIVKALHTEAERASVRDIFLVCIRSQRGQGMGLCFSMVHS